MNYWYNNINSLVFYIIILLKIIDIDINIYIF